MLFESSKRCKTSVVDEKRWLLPLREWSAFVLDRLFLLQTGDQILRKNGKQSVAGKNCIRLEEFAVTSHRCFSTHSRLSNLIIRVCRTILRSHHIFKISTTLIVEPTGSLLSINFRFHVSYPTNFFSFCTISVIEQRWIEDEPTLTFYQIFMQNLRFVNFIYVRCEPKFVVEVNSSIFYDS